MIRPELVAAILSQYRLAPFGIHGLTHWARVLENGRRLAAAGGARLAVVELFALFHDSCRRNEGWDPGHGRRGAALAAALRQVHLELEDPDFALLLRACAGHTDGGVESDPTVGACWDADRLDLARVDIRTDPRRLCTAAARDTGLLSWASERAAGRFEPSAVLAEWGLAGFP